MLTRADVLALLEDGPHALDELAAWVTMAPDVLALTLKAMAIPACERCSRRFIRKRGTSGRFCERRCYAGSLERPPVVARAPRLEARADASTTRLIDGVEFDIVFDGRQETKDWPSPWASSLVGCRRFVL